jgi:hypothetical protein
MPLSNAEEAITLLNEFWSKAEDRAWIGDAIAWGLYVRGAAHGKLGEYAVNIATRTSAEAGPENKWVARFTLAAVLLSNGEIPKALTELEWLAENVTDSGLDTLTSLCIDFAKKDLSAEVLTALSKSSRRENFEPLIVALRLVLNEEPRIAQEILEVARDIRARILDKERPQSLAST